MSDYAILSTALAGGLYLLLLFFLCAAGVIGFRYVRLQLRKDREKPAPKEIAEKKPSAEQKPDAEKPRAIYYLVEKKRARANLPIPSPRKSNLNNTARRNLFVLTKIFRPILMETPPHGALRLSAFLPLFALF